MNYYLIELNFIITTKIFYSKLQLLIYYIIILILNITTLRCSLISFQSLFSLLIYYILLDVYIILYILYNIVYIYNKLSIFATTTLRSYIIFRNCLLCSTLVSHYPSPLYASYTHRVCADIIKFHQKRVEISYRRN